MKNQNIRINNNDQKIYNILRKAITPKMIDYSYNRLIDIVSPIQKNKDYNLYKFNKENNFKKIDFNIPMTEGYNSQNRRNYYNPTTNITKQLKPYSNLMDFSHINNIIKNENINIHKKNVSLNQMQDEIKMMEIKLRSDIIKNKIRQLNDISNENKSKYNISYNKYKYDSISLNNKIYNYSFIQGSNNYRNNNESSSLIKQKNKEGKIYKIKKIKINNIKGSRTNFFNDSNNNIDNNLNYNYFKNNTLYNTKRNNKKYFDYSDENLKYNSQQNRVQNSDFNRLLLKKHYQNIIKKRIDNFLAPKKKIDIINMKNLFNDSIKNEHENTSISPSFITKSEFNANINYTNFGNSKININDNSNNYLRDSEINNNNDNIQKSFVELNFEAINNDKNTSGFLSEDLPQGFFDNYFINNYNIKNINKTTIYNNIEKSNKKEYIIKSNYQIKSFNNLDIINYKNNEFNNKLENKKKDKIVNFSFVSYDNDNKDNKNIKKDEIKNNNRIINTENFSFMPENNILNEKKNLPNKSRYSNINKNNNMKKELNKTKKNNNQQIKNNNINKENFVNKNKDKNEIYINSQKDKDLRPVSEISIIINMNKNIKDNKITKSSNNSHREQSKKQVNNKPKVPLIDPNELEQEAIILNNTMETFEKKKEEKNISINIKKKVSFEENKIIIKYNQNEYIKKFSITSNNNSKKIKHIFHPTKEVIKNLKNKNKIKSILLKKTYKKKIVENKNKAIKTDHNLALLKLNELITEFVDTNTKDNNKDNNNIDNEKKKSNELKEEKNSSNKNTFIKKNINYIKKIQESSKKGLNYKVLSKSEMKLLNKKKKDMGTNIQNNNVNNKINNDINNSLSEEFRIRQLSMI